MPFTKQAALSVMALLLLVSINTFGEQNPLSFSYYQVITDRNLFNPLWSTTPAPSSSVPAINRRDEERKREDQRKIEEQARAENLKKDIIAGLSLKGFVLQNGKTQAVIQNKMSGNKTSFVSEGETFDDITVLTIDTGRGTAHVNYKGQFTFELQQE